MTPVHFGDVRLPSRFWDKVSPEPNSGCWLWNAAAFSGGYGSYWIANSKEQLAHRAAYAALVASPEDQFVCHRCDTPICVNPNHMFLGAPIDNTRDMFRKNRWRAPNQRSHCIRGHARTPANVERSGGCKTCSKLRKQQKLKALEA
ncbi:hypothetical protein ACQKJZ_17590 [Sphingomonas sp. NPDC019816]|uniref:hypothetical protein n=1 Tax=Sphingomonas sp. NPDC019816 TaxID=3390679 RepID=UPI003CFFDA10